MESLSDGDAGACGGGELILDQILNFMKFGQIAELKSFNFYQLQ